MYIKNTLRITALGIFMVGSNACAIGSENIAKAALLLIPAAGGAMLTNHLVTKNEKNTFYGTDAAAILIGTMAATAVAKSYISDSDINKFGLGSGIIFLASSLLSALFSS